MMSAQSRGRPQQGGRHSHAIRRPVRSETNERWYFAQNTVKILQLSQDGPIVNVTLLRYTSYDAMFSTSTVWKLPFKMKNLRDYLMHPYLSEEEKEELGERLAGISTDQYKFEKLVAFRLNAICKVLPVTSTVESYNKRNNPDNDWAKRLFSGNTDNSFIQEVLTKNKLKSH